MMPARQASRRAWLAEIRPPVSKVHDPGGLESCEELFEGHRHHDGGADPTRGGQPVGVDGLEDLGERDPVADGLGQVGIDAAATGGVVTHRVGQGPDRLAQHRGVQRGHPELAMGDALGVLPHGEGGLARGLGFFGLEQLALICLGRLRGDHLEEPVTQDRERDRVVRGRLIHQVSLGLAALLSAYRELPRSRATSQVHARSPSPARCSPRRTSWLRRGPGAAPAAWPA